MSKKTARAGYLLPMVVAFVILPLGSCEILFGTSSSDSGPITWTYSSSDPVLSMDFGSGSSRTVTIKGAEGKSVYLVKANVSSFSAAADQTGSVATTSSRNVGGTLPVPARSNRELEPTVQRLEHQAAAAFNANPPSRSLSEGRASYLSAPMAATVSYGPAGAALGTTKVFYVQDGTGAFVPITAELLAAGEYCYIWVHEARYNNGSAANNDNLITLAQAEALRDKFDGSSGQSYRDGIFKNVTNIFGYEYGGGTDGSGGKDSDQHVAILVYDIDEDFLPDQSSGILGYFWAKDFYSQAFLDSIPELSHLKTNLAEIFYIDSHFMDRYTEEVHSTLAHEYQHMINFNEKAVKKNLNSPTWYDEMCSMAAEDLTIAKIGLDPETDGPIRRLHGFNYHYAESGVTDWLGSPYVLKSYASAFAFGAYLSRNYGGAELFRAMARSNSVGVQSITDALYATGTFESFNTVFQRYGEALVYTAGGAGVTSFNRGSTRTVGEITYTAVPVDLSALEAWMYTDGPTYGTGLYGPRVYGSQTLVALRPYGLSIHGDSAWNNLAGELELSVQKPGSGSVAYYLMVK